MADNDIRTLKDTSQIRVLSGVEDQNARDPVVVLRVSQDGGLSWGSERQEPMGKIGETKHRIMFRRLGGARDPIFELSGTDSVKVAIIGAFLEFQPQST